MEDQVNSVVGNMTGANESAMNFLNGTMSKFMSSGNKGFGNMKKISDEILKNFKEVWKIYQQMGIVSGTPGGGKLGLGSFSRAGKVGLGLAAAGGFMIDAMPSTAAAVTQRMAANTMVGLTGMGPNRLIGMANRGIGLGATSVGAPMQTAMALMYQGGMSIANQQVYNGVFRQIGGASAMSGMSNEAVASALSGVNAMNFLRTGTRVRDPRGNLLPVNQMVNNLFQSMYSGRKITREQAAMANNPFTAAYRTISQVSGGNQDLQALLTAGVQFRAIKGRDITAKDLRNPNKVFDILGLPKDDIQRTTLKKIFADNKLLEESQKGLVSGYNTSLNASANLTQGFTKIAEVLGPVYDGLANLKGILQTFPATGGVAGPLTSILSTAGGIALAGGLGGRLGAAGLAGKASTGGFLAGAFSKGNLLKGGGLAIGSMAAGAAANRIGQNFKGSDATRARGMAAAKIGQAALTGAAIGSIIPGVGTGIGAAFGTAVGAFQHGGQLISGIGGESDGIGGDTDKSTGSGKLKLQSPVPPGTRVSSKYGPREKAAADAKKKGKNISSFHRGTDYAVPIGTKVSAAGDGTVTETGNHTDYGLYIIITHGPKSTLYGHLSKIHVQRGQKVSAGDTIGLSGDTGQGVTGPHLHFEVRNNGGTGAQGRKDPENFLTRAFKAGKDIVTSGINLVKRISNKVFGTNFGYSDVLADKTPWDFTGSASLSQQLSSQSISETIANAINSGRPLGYSDFGGATGKFKTEGARGRVNGTENMVSGDSGTMVGGSRAGLIRMLYKAGFRGKGLETAFAVALAESGGRANAKNFKGRDLSYGLFQINMTNADPRSPNMGRNRLKQFGLQKNEQLYDPMTNIKAAYEISNGGKWWGLWGAYTDGSFVSYLDDARRAAAKAKLPKYHKGTVRVPEEQIALLDKDEMVIPPNLANQIRNGTSPAGGSTNISVKMDVNIARAGVAEVEHMFQMFKSKLETELNNKNMGIL